VNTKQTAWNSPSGETNRSLFTLIVFTSEYLVKSTDHYVPRYVVFSTPQGPLVRLRPKYSPQHPILENPPSKLDIKFYTRTA